MKRVLVFLVLLSAVSFLLSACQNLPVAPTKTPTMTEAEVLAAAQATAEEMAYQTQTQYAIENPSPTPTDTATPTPAFTPTSPLPLIPPTATEKPRPYLSVGQTSSVVYPVGNPKDMSRNFVPMETLYVEVCFMNAGSGTWNGGFRVSVTNQSGAGINPTDVNLNKNVGPDEWACFSFQNYNAEQSLGSHCPSFQLYTDAGYAVTNGQVSACWTIH